MRIGFIRLTLSFLLLFAAPFSGSSARTVFADTCTPVPNAPNLYQVSRTATDATLYFTPINEQITSYTIIYGLQPEDERYSASYNSGISTGAISYTISNLDPKQSYYFKVRANTSCTYSPWSSWVGDSYTPSSSLAGGAEGTSSGSGSTGVIKIPTLPVTGPKAMILATALPIAGVILGFFLFVLPARRKEQ